MTKRALVIFVGGLAVLGGCGTRTSIGQVGAGGQGGSGGVGGIGPIVDAGPGGQGGDGGTRPVIDAGPGDQIVVGPLVDADMMPTCGAGATDASSPPGTIAFQPAGSYVVGRTYYSAIVLEDISGDGKPDLIVTGNQTMSVFVNRGDGTFRDKTEYLTSENVRIAVGDLDGDGKKDIAVVPGQTGGVEVHLNIGGGALAPAVTYAAVGYGNAISVADLNGDGKNDIAVTNINGSSASLVVLTNMGGGMFSTASYPVSDVVTSIAVGDLNGDAFPDLLVGDTGDGFTPGGVTLLTNVGDGSFSQTASYGATTSPSYVSIEDLNGDGKPDMVLAGSSGAADVLLSAAGTFTTAVAYSPLQAGLNPQQGGPAFLAVGDLNGDGKPDIAFASYQAGVGTLPNHGNGTFGAPSTYPVCSLPGPLALGDLNGDGKLDLAVTTADGVSVFFNTSR